MVVTNKYREIARTSLTSKAVFYLLSTRERNRKNMNLARLRTEVRQILNSPMKDQEFMGTVKALETAGAGRIHYGVRGAPKYFFWSVPITEVARLGGVTKEELTQAEMLGPQEPKIVKASNLPHIKNGVRQESIKSEKPPAVVKHVVFVFPNGEVKTLDLSSDIPDIVLTQFAKLIMSDSKQEVRHNRRAGDKEDDRNKSNMPNVSDQ